MQQTASPDSVAALPCDARQPITVVVVPSRDLVSGHHLFCSDITSRRLSNAGMRAIYSRRLELFTRVCLSVSVSVCLSTLQNQNG